MRANVFIASKRSEEGARLLWRDVPVETAKRLCSLEEPCWAQSMLVWAHCDSLGLHPGDPVVDNGSLDHLLTEEEPVLERARVGARGGKEEGMKLDEFYTVPCPVEGCEKKATVHRSMPDGYTGLCSCQAAWLRLGWSTTAHRIPYLVVPEEPKRRRRRG